MLCRKDLLCQRSWPQPGSPAGAGRQLLGSWMLAAWLLSEHFQILLCFVSFIAFGPCTHICVFFHSSFPILLLTLGFPT